ncbi:hypothetical protein Misp01_01350 [Microtetraspora sp. NBRC 13810]|uniref:hypothetical protein n=1 Tax=Microtetraspora sp. NBRC 13810 TaxID=3030990 RepID=UPI0024A26B9A|nr:hypothetical protein [Microtetraspora sp. NBRC 13810]GLW05005.1 hypothetical protein Misp01_01350 [Microtetraspora sp. NBRC 13810]
MSEPTGAANASSQTGNPYQALQGGYQMPGMSGISGIAGMSGVAGEKPDVEYREGKIQALGDNYGKLAPGVQVVSDQTKGIDIPFPSFGVVGLGLNGVHAEARRGAASALDAARGALESWQRALRATEKSYAEAEEKNGGGDGGGTGGGNPFNVGAPDLSGLNGGMPKIDSAGFKNPDLSGLDPNGPGIKGPDLSGLDPDGPDIKNPDLDGLDPDGPDIKNPDLDGLDPDGPDIKNPDLDGLDPNGPDIKNPDLSGLNPNVPDPNTNVPGFDSDGLRTSLDGLNDRLSGMNDPLKTDLSEFDPSKMPGYDPSKVPGLDPNRIGAPGTNVPASWTGQPGTDTLTRGGGTGGVMPPEGTGALRAASGVNGLNGMPMMPMMPGMGGAPNEGRENESSIPLHEREEVWMDDEDIAPPVLGMEA